MAKIHTVEWTPGILANPVLERAMHANWYGLLPKWVRQKFGHLGTEMLGGVVGSPQAAPRRAVLDHRGVHLRLPAAPAAPRRLRDPLPPQRRAARRDRLRPDPGRRTRAGSWTSAGCPTSCTRSAPPTPARSPCTTTRARCRTTAASPATAWTWARSTSCATASAGVPRYNDFREKLRKPRVERFEDLTDNPQWAQEIRDVYDGDIDRVDLQVGLLAEPLPPGFGFSDTAFRIFILMASRG